MKKFSTYTKEEEIEIPKGYTQESDVARLTSQIAQAYDGKASMDVLQSIVQQAEESKRKGTLTNEDIDAFYKEFSPMLDSGQQKMLQVVVQRLKRI